MRTSESRRSFLRRTAALSLGVCSGLALPGANASAPTAPATSDPRPGKSAWPIWDETEEKALLGVLNSGQWGRTTGHRVKEFETLFAEKMQAGHCLATSSGTAALITSLGAAGIGPGDEVILPPYTFEATFNAITVHYALPVFVDSDPATFQIDPEKIPPALTASTKVLLPVHIGGSAADLDAIVAIARARNLQVIEDAAQAPLAQWRGRPVGTQGLAGCFSFQASKNLTSGEGGAVLTNDEAFANQCYNFHSPTGQKPGRPTGRGANFRLTEFQAGLLLAQWVRLEGQARTRSANAAYLDTVLGQIPGITPAKLVQGCTRSAYHLYMFRYDRRHFADWPRARFIQALAREGVSSSSGYGPLNRSAHVRTLADNPHYQRIYGKTAMTRWLERIQCPANDRLCQEAVWFTQSKLLGSRDDMERTAEAISRVQKQANGTGA